MPRASHPRRHPRGLRLRLSLACLLLLPLALHAQSPELRARRFTAPRTLPTGASPARTLATSRAANADLISTRAADLAANPTLAPLSAPWTPAGPAAIQSLSFGAISGRVTSLALDSSDPAANTLFVGTAGGGVWKSTNAAGPTPQVTFTPLTDTLPAFSPSAFSAATPSLSIGALLALPGGLVLAGTGDPNDSADSFYGTGLLRSADSGLTWSLIPGSHDDAAGNHSFFGFGFAGFAASSTTPGLIVAAVSQSAEAQLVNAPDTTNSVMGLYYSADSGLTWQMATVLDGSQTVLTPLPGGGNSGGVAATAVVWNPVRRLFFAAIRYHGFYQSADGSTWTRLPNQPGAGLTLSACPTHSQSATCPIFRGALAVQPVSGDTFALTIDSANHDTGLFQDACQLSGAACASSVPLFTNRLPSAPLETSTGIIPQADYNLTLAALPVSSPAPDTLLFVGTSDLFRCSLAAGCTLRNTTNTANGCASPAGVAPAQHAIVPGGSATSPVLFFGNDGGLWRSTDAVNQQASPCSSDDSAHFQNLNLTLGSLAEVVSLAQHPTDPAILLAGLGASGTVSTGRADQSAWQQLSSGEGGTVAIDPANPSLWYLSTAAGSSIAACPLGAACTPADILSAPTIAGPQVSGDLALLDAPWLLDPAQSATLLIGTCRVWRGPAATPALWSTSNAISPVLSGAQNPSCTSSNGFLRSLAVAGSATATGSSVLYAGLAGTLAGGGNLGGHLFTTSAANLASATTPWTDLAGSPVSNDLANVGRFNPGSFSISSLAADSHDATGRTVYATVQGFSGSGLSVPHIYRSTDAGGHWFNISANLPNAPANALVIDPNDANTVYVALDTGVYATTGVASCTSTNCWTLFGTALPNSPVTTLVASASLPIGDGRLGLLRAGTSGRGLWQIPLLTAATIQQPAVVLGPTALAFDTTAVGSTSVSRTIVVTNTGNAPLLVSSVAITSGNAPTGVTDVVTDFTSTNTCVGSSIAANASCSLAVTFAPSATGARTSTLTLYANIPGGQATASLTGTATAPAAVQLTPTSLTFPNTALSATSAPQNLVLQNTGGTTVSITSTTLTGAGFTLSANTCGVTLAPSTSCALSVVFHPSTLGTFSAVLAVTDTLGTQTATVGGTSIAPPTDSLSNTSLSFSTTQVGSTSATQQLILTNAGDTPLTLIATSIASASTNPDFTATNSCGNSLAPHSVCAVAVAFAPHTVGPVTATLSVADEFRTQTIALSGTGIAPPGVSLLPSSTVTFPATGIGSTSAPQVLTLTNNGGLPLVIGSVTLTGDFALAATGSTCSVSLAPSTACTVAVVFSPAAAGLRTGSLTIVDNAAASPTSPQAGLQTVPLSGTAVDFTLAADGPTSLTVASGASATFPLLLSSPAATPGVAAFTCTGLPANSICTISPQAVPLGGADATLVTVTLATGQSTTTAEIRLNDARNERVISTEAKRSGESPAFAFLRSPLKSAAALALLLPIALVTSRRRRQLPTLLTFILATTLTLLGGCSSSPREIPGTGTPSGASSTALPTPPGTYTLTITATSAGLSRSIDLTVIVQ